MPSRLGYYAGTILILIGLFLPFGWIVFHLITFQQKTQKVVVPGTHQLTLNQPGSYSIYYEYSGSMNGEKWEHDEELPPLACSIRQKASGAEPLKLHSPTGKSTYTSGSNSGIRVFTFEAPSSGNYILDVKAISATSVSPIVFAITPGGSGELIILILRCVAISTLTILPGASLLYFTYRRHRQFQMENSASPESWQV